MGDTNQAGFAFPTSEEVGHPAAAEYERFVAWRDLAADLTVQLDKLRGLLQDNE